VLFRTQLCRKTTALVAKADPEGGGSRSLPCPMACRSWC